MSRLSVHQSCLLVLVLTSGLAGAQRAADEEKQDAPWRDPEALVQGLLPKSDLGVDRIMAERPEADGRGVIVAVLDTGVDLLHAGLQRTSTGLPKIADFYDATDAGDLLISVTEPVVGGEVRGLTGRRLVLGDKGGDQAEVRLGRIRARTFFPRRLVRRVMDGRKKEKGERDRAERDRTYDEADDEKQKKEEEEPSDEGPVYDVVVFRHGEGWACAVDTDEDGDLAEETLLVDYRECHRVARFTDELNFAMGANLAPDGSRISFLFDGGGHGTHVAGIIGAYYAEGDPLNGLAPGAQILAIKVGNHRLGGATTHMSIIKGLDYAARHGARVVNASFGGGSFFQDGREETAAFANDLIDQAGLLCFFSAGNAGPALSTVGSPALGERIFAIGAMVSAVTQASNYGVLDPRGAQLFDFSSRGPLYGGGVGIDLLAPGVALSPVPTWFVEAADSWNGTSMAAPQASGAMAVILSYAREEGLITSYRKVRRALESSARPLDHLAHIEQGAGLMDVPGAIEELRTLTTQPEPTLWKIEVSTASGTGGGIYERCVVGDAPFRRTVRIEPELPDEATNEEKSRFLKVLRLEGLPAWARAVPLVHSAIDGARIEFELEPGEMQDGLNAALVRAIDTDSGEEELTISLVAIRPQVLAAADASATWSWNMRPGDRRSAFLQVPQGATRARLEVEERGEDAAAVNSYTVVLSQPSPWSGSLESRRRLAFDDEPVQKLALAVEGGAVLEVVAYSRWHTSREGQLEMRVTFDGLMLADPSLDIPPGAGGAMLKVHAPLGATRVRIETSIEGRRTRLPVEWSVQRDPRHPEVGEDDTMFVGIGRATIRAVKDKEKLVIALTAPDELDDFLDDAFYRIRDPHGVEVGRGFLHSGRADFEAPARGDYEFEATVVARGRTFLEAGMERLLSLELVRKLDGKVDKPAVHRDIYSGVPGENALKRLELRAGERADLYLRVPDLEKQGAGRINGKVKFVDGLASPPLAECTFEVDLSLSAESATGMRDAALTRAREDFEQALWLEDAAALERAQELLVGLGDPASELDQLESRTRTVAPSGVEATREAIDAFIAEEAAKEEPGDARLGRAHALAAVLEARAGEHATAAERVEQAREHKAPGSMKLELECIDARNGEDHDKAADAALALAKARPFDQHAARWVIETAVAAGRQDRARHDAGTWLDRFPEDVAGARAVLELTR